MNKFDTISFLTDAIKTLVIAYLYHTKESESESKKDELLKTLVIYKELIEIYGKDGIDAYFAAIDEGNKTVDASRIANAIVYAKQICIDEAELAAVLYIHIFDKQYK